METCHHGGVACVIFSRVTCHHRRVTYIAITSEPIPHLHHLNCVSPWEKYTIIFVFVFIHCLPDPWSNEIYGPVRAEYIPDYSKQSVCCCFLWLSYRLSRLKLITVICCTGPTSNALRWLFLMHCYGYFYCTVVMLFNSIQFNSIQFNSIQFLFQNTQH